MASTSPSTEQLTLEYLHNIIPENFDTVVFSFTPGTKEKDFEGELRINVFEKEDAERWLTAFEEKSLTIWRVSKTFEADSTKLKFKKVYHCFHTTKRKRNGIGLLEQIRCPAQLTITVKQVMKRGTKDPYGFTHPCAVHLRFCHDHDIASAYFLKCKTPNEEVHDIFRGLFAKGHSASSAFAYYKTQLTERPAISKISRSAKHEPAPTLVWSYNFHQRLFKTEYGCPNEEEITSLEKAIDQYNNECGDACAAICKNDMLTIALCSPLMKRVHRLIDTCHEVIYIDSSRNRDRHHSRIFMMLCPTFVGTLPLGMFIVYSLSPAAIIKGLKLLQTIFPKKSFYGMLSPQVIMTEDLGMLRNSLSVVFPNASLYLSKFHIMQSVMTCLWNMKSNVSPCDKKKLYAKFRDVFHSDSEEQMQERFKDLCSCSSQYSIVKEYFSVLDIYAPQWAPYLYSKYHIQEHKHNDYYLKGTFRIFADKVCQRVKAFNIVHLFQFFISNFNEMYKTKIIDFLNGKIRLNKRKKFFCSGRNVDVFTVEKLDKFLYEVYDVKKEHTYIVDTDVICCNCSFGLQGLLCKHQHAVVKEFNLISHQYSPNEIESAQTANFFSIALEDDSELYEEGKDDSNLTPDVESGSHSSPNNNSENEDDVATRSILCYPIFGEETVEVILESEDTLDILQTENVLENESGLENGVLTDCQENLRTVFNDISQRLEEKPEVFSSVLNEFVKSYRECKTDSELVNALSSFGMCVNQVTLPAKEDKCIQKRTDVNMIPLKFIIGNQ